MWLSSTSKYAIRAVIYVAGRPRSDPVRGDDIAKSLRSPRNYLSKTLHALVRAGILRSVRGPKGGFQLTARPDQVSLSRIIAPFEPPDERRCLFGRPECGGAHPCSVHDRWTGVAGLVEDFFANTTVADLLEGERGRVATGPEIVALSSPKPRRARAGPRPT
jgi:Rrf2 family transcriptional regulator, iron-sulfur cluster assembly transcription factor